MDKKYISVIALNKYIKSKFNQDISLQSLYIKGEISNYRPHPSGHIYFTLKDEDSRINAVMFASAAKKIQFHLENGMQVLIHGSVSVYEATGQYQIYVDYMIQDGIGALYTKFNELKEKLQKEGLFDNQYKKDIPLYPRKIAVLSAKQGAALQDILKTIHLRFPFVRVVVFPIPVQGSDAYLQIIEMLKFVDRLNFDTIIIARGGGSIEDLWNFNEELLARCIFECITPIISGVGHETDFTICDFVSDYRAATPTAAAIKATPDQNAMKQEYNHLYNRLVKAMNNQIKNESIRLKNIKDNYYLRNPEHLYTNQFLKLMNLQERFYHYYQSFDTNEGNKISMLNSKLINNMDKIIHQNQYLLNQLIVHLDAISPLKVLQRGYVLVEQDDTVIHSSSVLKENDEVNLRFYDGIKKAIIK